MKKVIIIFVLSMLVLTNIAAQQTAVAQVTFAYTRLSGSASNQYAVWIETADGQFVKTLYATRWTANGGWRRRPTSIPMWINRANVASMSQSQIDAVSGATPRTGTVTYTWDGTNTSGAGVANGDYVIILEGTLRWENQVYYRAPIRLGQGAAVPQVSVEYLGDATNDRSMISDVRVQVFR